jgi:hypothetical protein
MTYYPARFFYSLPVTEADALIQSKSAHRFDLHQETSLFIRSTYTFAQAAVQSRNLQERQGDLND